MLLHLIALRRVCLQVQLARNDDGKRSIGRDR
jgi:hypothetical protein